MRNVRTNRSSNAAAYATGLLLAVVVGAFPTPARAQTETDSKILPATMCQLWGPFENNLSQAIVSEIHNAIRYTENGRVENWHPTYKIAVVCPLVRDLRLGSAGLADGDVPRQLPWHGLWRQGRSGVHAPGEQQGRHRRRRVGLREQRRGERKQC
jgi:hypothetical protein